MPMRVTINPTTCVASASCSRTAPRVFANRDDDGGFVSVIDENPPEAEWAAVREAENLCPSATISIEEDDTGDVSGSA
ncbi:ferredoxin [Promicromonospora soli]